MVQLPSSHHLLLQAGSTMAAEYICLQTNICGIIKRISHPTCGRGHVTARLFPDAIGSSITGTYAQVQSDISMWFLLIHAHCSCNLVETSNSTFCNSSTTYTWTKTQSNLHKHNNISKSFSSRIQASGSYQLEGVFL
jgi:hypothetical protein